MNTASLCGAAKYGEIARANFAAIESELAHAIHDNVAGEISALEEVSAENDDVLLLETPSKGRLRIANLPELTQTAPPQGTWASATTISFAARPGQPATVRRILPDGKLRTMTSLVWDAANGVADLGYDEAGSQGNSKFLYFYIVPQSNDDDLLTIVASDNDPATGPANRSTFECVWITYNSAAGSLLAVVQVGNHFSWKRAQAALSIGAAAADAVVTLSLDRFVPVTARIVDLLAYYQSKGTRGRLFIWVDGEAGAGDIGDPSDENNTTWHMFANNPTNDFGSGTCFAPVPLAAGNRNIQYQPKSGCNVALIHVCGWVDEAIAG